MIEEILTFSSLEAGRELVCPRAFDAAEVLRGVAAVVEPLATAKGLAFVCETAVGLGAVHSDADKVRQIVINLAGNAVKFTDRGEVRLVLRAEDGNAVLEVADTGIGIAPEHLEHVFEPFWQAEPGVMERGPGIGLGLALLRRLTWMLGGDVRVRSEPGRGSVFAVAIPAA